jgi:adenylate cyclase
MAQQIIDGGVVRGLTTGGHIWAERFDGNMADVFTIQDEVNRKIVSALAVNLTQNDRERLEQKRTSSPDAYYMLLRGLELFQRFAPEDNAKSREFFKKAAALDPSYARAYANLSWSHTGDVNMNWTKKIVTNQSNWGSNMQNKPWLLMTESHKFT